MRTIFVLSMLAACSAIREDTRRASTDVVQADLDSMNAGRPQGDLVDKSISGFALEAIKTMKRSIPACYRDSKKEMAACIKDQLKYFGLHHVMVADAGHVGISLGSASVAYFKWGEIAIIILRGA